MTDEGTTTTHVGRPTLRLEDERFVTGTARWTDNVAAPGALRLGIVRSPLAHARITGIDLTAARSHPNVVAAFTGADLLDTWCAPLPVKAPPGAHRPHQPPVAVGKVRYVGEPVAVIVTASLDHSEDALELVDIEYDPLPGMPTVTEALHGDVLIHEDGVSNVAYTYDGKRVGDLAAALDEADVVLRRRYRQQRVMASAMEPRAVVAEPGPGDRLVVHLSSQAPHRIRDTIALLLGMTPEHVRVIAPDVGGGFGAKLDCYPEELLCAALARRLQRPVRYTGTRTEDLQGTHQGRSDVRDLTIAARRDGTLLALDVQLAGDCGAYLSRVGANIQLNSEAMSPGCYRWQAYRFQATGVFTNAVPTAAYRGAGRPEAIFGIERAIDDLAAALDMDPAELRRRNFPEASEFPFPSIGGLTFDSGDYSAALDAALNAVDYTGWRREQQRRRAAGAAKRVGIGLASYMDRCGTGPGLPEHGSVDIDDEGGVTVRTGLAPTGQGTATSLAQIVADQLGLDPEQVRVIYGDTDLVPDGAGTFGSRSMPVGAVAVSNAAARVATLTRRVAAEILEAAETDLKLAGGRVAVRGSPDVSLSLAAVAAAAQSGVLPDVSALTATSAYDPEGLTFPYGALAAVVEVDTETGHVDVLRFVAVDDCGTVINPALVDGQLHGGLTQGLAQALYEEAVYDDSGNLLTSSFVDYLVPSAPDVPHFELHRMVTPSGNPLGTKGVGEAGTIGAPPAIVNAVVDAVREFGVTDIPMPCTPQRVWRAIQDAISSRTPGVRPEEFTESS